MGRLKRLRVSTHLLMSNARDGFDAGGIAAKPGDAICTKDPIPADAEIVSACMAYGVHGTVEFTLWSADFPVVPDGQPIPEISPEFTRS